MGNFWEWRWWRSGGRRAVTSGISRFEFQPVTHYINPHYSVTCFPVRFYPILKDLPTQRREIQIFPWQPLTMVNLER